MSAKFASKSIEKREKPLIDYDALFSPGHDYDMALSTCRHLDVQEVLKYIFLSPQMWLCPHCGQMASLATELEGELIRPYIEALSFG